jgi:4-aminobutyrate aminotransferase-like enzyme/Ser/Thr protein kinase RdoA (MazF antagonist)
MTTNGSETSAAAPAAFDTLPEAAVLSAPSAPVDVDKASALLHSLYGIDAELTPLSGERDANFLVSPSSAATLRPAVLKISHPVEDPQVADYQTQALLHLEHHAPDLPVQRLHPTIAGRRSAIAEVDGTSRVVRLFSFVEGMPMPLAPRSRHQQANVARTLARLDRALTSLPPHIATAHRLPWDIQRADSVRSLIGLIDSPHRQSLVTRALDGFEQCAKPQLSALRRQAIHNDFNLFNLLVDPQDTDTITGILDFGDMVEGPTIDDVAVAASYQLDENGDALGAIVAFAAAYHEIHPLEPTELDILLDLIRARLAMVVCISGWRAARNPANASYVLRNNAISWARLVACHSIDNNIARTALRDACPPSRAASCPTNDRASSRMNSNALPSRDLSELLERRTRLLGPAYRLFYDHPLHLVRGEGVWLHAADGKRYLDAYNNVACVGHAHPHVVEAISRQAGTLNTHTRYLHTSVLDYAERLLATMPSALGHAMFTCTGSEANDLALRIARTHTGAQGVIITSNAYHGVTSALAEASPSLGAYVKLGRAVRAVAEPKSCRLSSGQVSTAFADGVRAAIADLNAAGLGVAALLVDTVFSSDGIYTDPPGFLDEAVEAVRESGGVYIADEVQPGFGRTGETFWGYQRHGITPDIVTMGKPMGNGHPVAGLTVRPEVLAAFARECRYFNTFGGNPVSMAAANAVLDVIETERLQANAHDTGKYLQGQLTGLAERHPCISEVRGAGLFVGVELVDAVKTGNRARELATRLVNRLREEEGILISATGPHGDVLKIRPPLVFDRTHADLLTQGIDRALTSIGH